MSSALKLIALSALVMTSAACLGKEGGGTSVLGGWIQDTMARRGPAPVSLASVSEKYSLAINRKGIYDDATASVCVSLSGGFVTQMVVEDSRLGKPGLATTAVIVKSRGANLGLECKRLDDRDFAAFAEMVRPILPVNDAIQVEAELAGTKLAEDWLDESVATMALIKSCPDIRFSTWSFTQAGAGKVPSRTLNISTGRACADASLVAIRVLDTY